MEDKLIVTFEYTNADRALLAVWRENGDSKILIRTVWDEEARQLWKVLKGES